MKYSVSVRFVASQVMDLYTTLHDGIQTFKSYRSRLKLFVPNVNCKSAGHGILKSESGVASKYFHRVYSSTDSMDSPGI